jgi:prepilin-type N-terminal cleavage/methylation domain-containing protein
MQKHKGFTIIELTIAMVVMVILLGVGVVSLRSAQMKSKDSERQADAQTIAAYVEQLYAKELRDGSNNVIKKAGTYPSTILWSNATYKGIAFADLDTTATYAPDIVAPAAPSLRHATNTSPAPTKDEYYYLPRQADGTVCSAITQECRTFQVYYRTEVTNEQKIIEGKRK